MTDEPIPANLPRRDCGVCGAVIFGKALCRCEKQIAASYHAPTPADDAVSTLPGFVYLMGRKILGLRKRDRNK